VSFIASELQLSGFRVTVDLPGSTYALPFALSGAALRPDIVLVQDIDIWFLELTVPFESNFDDAHLRKSSKYSGDLLAQAKTAGFIPHLLCFELGSRGLSSPSWRSFSRQFKISSACAQHCLSLALRASYTIWSTRFLPWGDPPLLSV
jgi:hypothetical protein